MKINARKLTLLVAIFGYSLTPTMAQDSVSFVSYGGSFQEAQEEAFVKPYAEKHGINLVTDAGPSVAQIRSMVEAGDVQWDVVEVTEADYLNLVRQDLLEPIDYSVFDEDTLKAIDSHFLREYGVAAVIYTYGVGYRTDFEREEHPESFTDFWDTERFPGPRAVPTGTFANPPWEMALLADGVDPDNLHPIDFERALKKLEEIEDHVTVWFEDTAPGVQALISGRVDYGLLPNGRVLQAKADGAPVDFAYGQGLLYADYFVVPKGAPNKKRAMELLAYASKAGPSAEFMRRINYSMPNQEALERLDEDYAGSLPTAPENFKRQVPVTGEFYRQEAPDGRTWQEVSVEIWNEWFHQ